jgi:hypothetical protein
LLPPIAFSKIDGFDVTPRTPSLSTSDLSSPLAMIRVRGNRARWPGRGS